MMTIDMALRMAKLFAEIAADVSGVACMCMMGPCADGVRWEVLTAETGARIAVGVVAVGVDAREEAPAEEEAPPAPRARRGAAGRN